MHPLVSLPVGEKSSGGKPVSRRTTLARPDPPQVEEDVENGPKLPKASERHWWRQRWTPRSGFRKQKEHQGARRCPLPPPLFETELRNDDASRDDGPPGGESGGRAPPETDRRPIRGDWPEETRSDDGRSGCEKGGREGRGRRSNATALPSAENVGCPPPFRIGAASERRVASESESESTVVVGVGVGVNGGSRSRSQRGQSESESMGVVGMTKTMGSGGNGGNCNDGGNGRSNPPLFVLREREGADFGGTRRVCTN
mmetsp:Transcript_30494/g.91037  ORF Transcript_30494/g.91037 Transcript_30494/m.91037 type:complete len:257 (-) Transcript_30494:270-1040(-)